MIDGMKTLLVMYKDGYEPYMYDKFPSIPKNLSRVIKIFHESNNIVSLDYYDKLMTDVWDKMDENKDVP